MRTETPLCRLLFCLALALAAGAPPVAAAEIDMQPFVIDHLGREDSPVDVSFLLGNEPAGSDGFVTVKDGHLVRGNGERFRIWGVNLTGWTRGSTLLPPKEEAERWARIMVRHGINCVRFHFLDLPARTPDELERIEAERDKAAAEGQRFKVRPAGLIDSTKETTHEFDAGALDRLDYFIHELKKAGIYSNLNLNVGRGYKPGDNVPDSAEVRLWKGFTYIGDRLIELQKDYAKRLLAHYNPYTKTEYRHEPAIATVEIVNENSIYEFWMRNWLRGELVPGGPRNQLDFTPFYARQLDEMYQKWLAKNRTAAQVAQIRQQAGVAPGAPVPRLHRGDFSIASKERFHAEAEFLGDVERDYFRDMKACLKDELGVKPLIIGNADHTYWIPNQPMMRANSLLDIIDGHVYWQHPAIWGARNSAMVNQPARSIVVKLSRSPFLGRPFTVSEVNHPNPNEYAAEMIPILASYAAFQDWDGIYFYTFEPKAEKDWEPFVADEFDITLDPVKMSQMAAGALLFLRADVSPARETFARTYSRAQVNEAMRLPEAERPYFTPGFPLSLPLHHGSRIKALDAEPTAKLPAEVEPPFISDTGELGWHLKDGKQGAVAIDTPRSQGLVGFLRDHPRTTKHLKPELKNDFAVLTLSSLTDEPIQRSTQLLLTACSRWQNTGSKWNERRTLWETWGGGPTLIEPVTGWLELRELDGAVAMKVMPLDGAAKPIGEPMAGRRLEDGWEITLGSPATTQYLIEIVR